MTIKFKPYFLALGAILFLKLIATVSSTLGFNIIDTPDQLLLISLFTICALFILSFTVHYAAERTPIPPFVIAIFFGIAGQYFFAPLLAHNEILQIIVGLGATLILFGGGLETPFRSFKKLSGHILSLSSLGLLITAFLFSLLLVYISNVVGLPVSQPIALILGAVLASTDPAAIIPTLKGLRFARKEVKDIIISESAITDVFGTLLSVIFLAIIVSDQMHNISIVSAYQQLMSFDTLRFLSKEVVVGVSLGLFGYGLLHLLYLLKKKTSKECEVDSAVFLFIPIFVFTSALFLGGSGYLAAFIAGLLFHVTDHLRETETFFNHIVDGFFKPTIFIILGAMVNISSLLEYAWVGLIISLLFIFVIRPLAVAISLGLFVCKSNPFITIKDLIFISWVRETGVIPAVLLVSIVSMGAVGFEALIPIGTWVILTTLIVQPIATPWLAKRLGVAESISDHTNISHYISQQQTSVLATRGKSFLRRLHDVYTWSHSHNIKKIIILLCLEENYSTKKVAQLQQQTNQEFERIKGLFGEDDQEMELQIISRKGFLQKNLQELAKEDVNISAFFVGKRMLDYKLEEIKQIQIPFYFMD